MSCALVYGVIEIGMSAFVAEQALKDPEFRRALVADPKRQAEKALGGIGLPDDLVVKVLEENVNEVIIVLPPAEERGAHFAAMVQDHDVKGWC